jgi:NitT/TauT family transport system ATP-binding protein
VAEIAPQSVVFEQSSLPDVVELRDVGQSYDGGKSWIIKHCNFLVEDEPGQGQFPVVLGRSGCGKSTLLRYIAGLQEPTEGQVLIHEKPRTPEHSVSMVFQQYSSLPCYTVLENVALPLRYLNLPMADQVARAMEMIKFVGLDGHEHKYAKMPALSGGQLQRVAVARSLITANDIVLFDEPFGALDSRTRMEMQLLVHSIWSALHQTCIFVTHDIAEAVFLGTDIYIMRAKPGQIEKRIHVDLPLARDVGTKQSPRFVALIQQVERELMAVSAV